MPLNRAANCASNVHFVSRPSLFSVSRILDFIHRHEPRGQTLSHLKSGIGAVIGMTLVGGLAAVTGLPMLLAPFGATAVLLFGQAESPLAQPANVFGGYLLAVLIAAAVLAVMPNEWWAATLAVGLAIAAMLALRVTHPPAGAVPLVAFSTHMPPATLFIVVVVGAACLVAVATVHHRLPPRVTYPRRPPDPA
jgi:CBS-domain-containing membrane protein